MEYVKFKNADMKASRIGLGTWSIGGWMWGGSDESKAIDTIHRALDQGINFIDTAPVYGFGRAEEIVGRALKSRAREEINIATKVGIEWSEDHQRLRRNATKSRISQEIDDSLRRLQTDYIDLYQLHWPDAATPMAETADALEQLRETGKIRAIGVSNFTPTQMERFADLAPLAANQPPYNLFERDIEQDVLPWARKSDLDLVTYGVLCRGLLSGRINQSSRFPEDDMRRIDPKFQTPRFTQYLSAVNQLDAWAKENHSKDILCLALRWVLDQPGVSVALWGARRPEQLDPLDQIGGWHLNEPDFQAIDKILEATIRLPVGPEFMAPPQNPAS